MPRTRPVLDRRRRAADAAKLAISNIGVNRHWGACQEASPLSAYTPTPIHVTAALHRRTFHSSYVYGASPLISDLFWLYFNDYYLRDDCLLSVQVLARSDMPVGLTAIPWTALDCVTLSTYKSKLTTFLFSQTFAYNQFTATCYQHFWDYDLKRYINVIIIIIIKLSIISVQRCCD